MANHSEIIDEIEALAVHCRAPLMSVDQRSRWAMDWAQDLAKFDTGAIRDAFRDWRHSGNAKFPTAGQIVPMIRAKMPKQGGADQRPQLWSDDMPAAEYQAMSLSDKIRHHRIAAVHCRQMAGPMPHKGEPVRQEDMPQTWKSWRARAVRHDEQEKALTATLRQCEERA